MKIRDFIETLAYRADEIASAAQKSPSAPLEVCITRYSHEVFADGCVRTFLVTGLDIAAFKCHM